MRRRARKPEPPARRARLEIVEIGAQGDGVGHDEGAPVFVPLTAPGDVATVEIRGERGRVVELIENSPHRGEPPCPHYGECGGCALQHVNEGFYRAWKRDRVVGALARAGLGETPVEEIVRAPAASRRRAVFAARRGSGRVVFGFNRRRSADLVDIATCHVLHPDLLARLPALKTFAAEVPAGCFDFAVTLCRNGLDIDIAGERLAEPR